MDTIELATQCAPNVDPLVMSAIVSVESGGNPFSIGVVNGVLQRQPRNKTEAIATARALHQAGWNFSLGKSQVNRYNLAKYGLDYSTVFDPCSNIRAGAAIFSECYGRATTKYRVHGVALQAALSCYYSGNFRRGFIPDTEGKPSYVAKVMQAAASAGPQATHEQLGLAIPVRPTSKFPRPALSATARGNAAGAHSRETPALVEATAPASKTTGRQKSPATPYDGYEHDEDATPNVDGYGAERTAVRVRASRTSGRQE